MHPAPDFTPRRVSAARPAQRNQPGRQQCYRGGFSDCGQGGQCPRVEREAVSVSTAAVPSVTHNPASVAVIDSGVGSKMSS